MRIRFPRESYASAAGFSLLELLVVLAVVGVLAALGGPAFRDMIRDEQLNSASSRLTGALLLARSEAIKRNRRVVLCVPTDPDAAEEAMQCQAAPSGWEQGIVVFANVTGDAQQINSDGDTTDGNCSEDEDCVIAVIAPAGGSVTTRVKPASGSATIRDITFAPDGSLAGSNRPYVTACDPRGAAHSRAVIVTPSGRPVSAKTAPGGIALSCPTTS